MYPKDNAFMYPNDNLLFTSEEIKKYEELFKRCEEEGSKNGICVTEALGMRSKWHMRFMEYTRYREIEIGKTDAFVGQREILDSTGQENIKNQMNLLINNKKNKFKRKDDLLFMYSNDPSLSASEFTSEEIKSYEELFKKCKQNDNRCLTSALGMHPLNHERYMTYGIFRKTETKGGQRETLDSTAQENIRNQLNLLVRKDDLSSSETCTAQNLATNTSKCSIQ